MINNNKRFLYKVDNDKYGYICNIFDGKYIFNDEENKNIKDKLQELAYNTVQFVYNTVYIILYYFILNLHFL